MTLDLANLPLRLTRGEEDIAPPRASRARDAQARSRPTQHVDEKRSRPWAT